MNNANAVKEGMVGLPSARPVFVSTRALHGNPDRVYSIGCDIGAYSGIDAGLCVLSSAALSALCDDRADENAKSAAGGSGKSRGGGGREGGRGITSLLSSFASKGSLRLVPTRGRTWFSVATKESAEFTKEVRGVTMPASGDYM